jgi:ribonuclease P/MRP protein subunit RPP1
MKAVGYSTIAFNVVLQPGTYDSNTVASYNPCFNAHPVFPELDSRTVDPNSGVQGILQLSRITVMLDENSISGGKGNGSMFVSYYTA